MMFHTGRSGALFVAALLMTFSAGVATAETWPSRPITMVVPFAAGSASDVVGRILGARMSELLGQQVIIENLGGAGGTTGTNRVAKAEPDGYQFVIGGVDTMAMSVALYKKLPYDAANDFVPVALVVDQPIVLVARKDLPVDTLEDFIAFAKANPGKMQYGSAGVGSGSHLACAQLLAAAGAEATHIPYRGSAPAMQDILAGRIDFICALGAAAIPQLASNAVKPIAVLTKNRSPLVPDIATADEQGVKDFNAYFWSGFFLPKGTPAEIVAKMEKAAIDTINTPVVQERLKNVGTTVVPDGKRSADYLKTFLNSEIANWGSTIKASGVSLD